VDEGVSVDKETISRAQAQLDRLIAMEKAEQNNRQSYKGPWIARPQHVRTYFATFDDVLSQVRMLPVLDEEYLASLQKTRNGLGIHRDDMASLMGLVADLRSSLTSKLEPFHEELEHTRSEKAQLKEELKQKDAELARINRIK